MNPSDDIKLPIGRALGRIPSGVFILTATHAGQSTAMLASWVQQAAFNPPCLSVAIANDRPALALIQQSQSFALSIIPQADTTLMKRYARGLKPGEDPFANIPTATTPAGLTYLADALAFLECRLLSTCTYNADHQLLIAQITAGATLREGPSFTHLRGNGFHY